MLGRVLVYKLSIRIDKSAHFKRSCYVLQDVEEAQVWEYPHRVAAILIYKVLQQPQVVALQSVGEKLIVMLNVSLRSYYIFLVIKAEWIAEGGRIDVIVEV